MNTLASLSGRIHSVETCGTVDGPGIRFVIFTQGCPLRCLYCHNPDCRDPHEGQMVAVESLISEIQAYKSYLRQGGVTVTGGEPLMQPDFVAEIFRRCHQLGLHTALDTSGYVNLESAKQVLTHTDLVLLDIKSYVPEIYRHVTQVALEPTLTFARYLADSGKPTWLRFVLVPGLTDSEENVRGLAHFVANLSNIERVEVLPFHKMGEYKWQQLGLPYALKGVDPPTPDQVNNVLQIFRDHGLMAV
ncbi:MAG: pyruvate formate lyase-activating protein [Synechococcaceae cyanobacterium SM2_3_2]|nr:pyruvate formate lyase-activating protein [Synechococcaceae cyanobacterium SM2_3_2]